jgi:hypothetical protein
MVFGSPRPRREPPSTTTISSIIHTEEQLRVVRKRAAGGPRQPSRSSSRIFVLRRTIALLVFLTWSAIVSPSTMVVVCLAQQQQQQQQPPLLHQHSPRNAKNKPAIGNHKLQEPSNGTCGTACVNNTLSSTHTTTTDTFSPLQQARSLQLPSVSATSGGEGEHLEFWQQHEELLQQAWNEWSAEISSSSLPDLEEVLLMNPSLYHQVHQLWTEPSLEREQQLLQSEGGLWEEPIPGVWVCRNFFTPTGLRRIREHLRAASDDSGIPTRRPNGMNRYGLVLDHDTQGGVSYPQISAFRKWLVDRYVRPLGRTFFPEFSGKNEQDDIEAYAFTIHYKEQPASSAAADAKTTTKGDVRLPEHSDASIFTMNINLNLPEEDDYEGSILEFVVNPDTTTTTDPDETPRKASLRMEPGMAVLHRGMQVRLHDLHHLTFLHFRL